MDTRTSESPFQDAVDFALAHPTHWPLDIRSVIESQDFDPPPWNIVKGPLYDRIGSAGVISVNGSVAASWGDTAHADMVFSVTKSYIGLLAGIALDEGRIADLDAPVGQSVPHPAFAAPNDAATWRQLLQQTSEWQGTLWGIPDTVDRNRQLSSTEDGSRFNTVTPYGAPGSYWDYNDIRVNALCLALTCVFETSLRDVLRSRFPEAFAGVDWDWNGYPPETTVDISGRSVPVVVGGGHWGGGIVTSVMQDAALGELVVGSGLYNGRRIISGSALGTLLSPCALMPVYGGLWWLNTHRKLFPSAPVTSVFALGVGMNGIWIDAPHGIVAVVHGFGNGAFGAFIERTMRALG
ncbi:serine hydrolase [Rhizobium sp. CG5]|uniref:serine hydrolase n=1 Tax=Rhizobium sp. CG5 TaxID=2726076 RepID=UPI0020349398|nr:serine hydrolase [Rhizobium sp. CG5]MCM2477824.1 serine hydrolase [Rhizobium sp. CG5]